jgi:hypothetical protein
MITGVLSWMYGTYNDIERTQEWGINFRAKLTGMERFEEYERLWEGLLLYYGGEPEKAASLLDKDIEACCLDVMDDYMGPLLAFLLCTLAFESRDYQTVIRLTGEAVESMQDLKLRLFLPDIRMIKGNALIALGDTQAGIDSLNEAYLEAKAIQSKRGALFILAALVEAELARNNLARAEELRQEGREILDFISGNMNDSKLLAAFLSDKTARIIMGQDKN